MEELPVSSFSTDPDQFNNLGYFHDELPDPFSAKEMLASINEVDSQENVKEEEKEQEQEQEEEHKQGIDVTELMKDFCEENDKFKNHMLNFVEKISKICGGVLMETNLRGEEYYSFEEIENGIDGDAKYTDGQRSVAKPVIEELCSFLEKLRSNNNYMDRLREELDL